MPGGVGYFTACGHSLSPQMSNWVLTCLLPVVYWQQQIDKTKTLTLKQAYHSALTHAQLAYRHDR